MKVLQGSSFVSENTAYNSLNDEFIKLQKAIEVWKTENLAIAPVSGIVLITNESVRN